MGKNLIEFPYSFGVRREDTPCRFSVMEMPDVFGSGVFTTDCLLTTEA